VQTSNAMFINTSQIEQQFEISRLRAIETGRYVLVAATNGVSGVVAPDGTVLSRAEPRTQEVLTEEVRLSSAITPAVRIGPWLGRACAVAAVAALCFGLLPYRRRQRRGEEVRPWTSRTSDESSSSSRPTTRSTTSPRS
jgi:apolipoprotein N-acyltransferase